MRYPHRAAFLSLALAAAAPLSAQMPADRAHLDAMSREHAHETPSASAATAPAPAQDVTGRDVVYGTVEGKQVRGYLARPARVARGQVLPGVLIIHEWWGLNDNIKTMARRLAGEGYQVLAVDMYGQVATTPEQAREYMGEIMANSGRAAEHIRAGTEFLSVRQRAPRVGVLGWCFGGGWALHAAMLEPERIEAAVMYYGRPNLDPERLRAMQAPLLGIFGAEDRGIPVDAVRRMEAILREQGKEVEIQVYEGAGHAFANPSGDSYRAEAAEDAWRRTTAFLGRHLRAPSAPVPGQ